MASRLTTNQEIAGSTPAVVIKLFLLSHHVLMTPKPFKTFHAHVLVEATVLAVATILTYCQEVTAAPAICLTWTPLSSTSSTSTVGGYDRR
jgi:hypothetical protein